MPLAKTYRPSRGGATVTFLKPRPAKATVTAAAPRPARKQVDPGLQNLAVSLAAQFEERDLTLTDPDTAAALRAAADFIGVLLVGAHRLGRLGDGNDTVHAYLQSILDDVRAAPDLI